MSFLDWISGTFGTLLKGAGAASMPNTTVATVAGVALTSKELQGAATAIGSSLLAFAQALEAKNYGAAELIFAEDALSTVGEFIPGVGLAAPVLQLLYTLGSQNLTMTAAEKAAFPSTQSPNHNTAGPGGIFPTRTGNDN
jgi:hypothetical protein